MTQIGEDSEYRASSWAELAIFCLLILVLLRWIALGREISSIENEVSKLDTAAYCQQCKLEHRQINTLYCPPLTPIELSTNVAPFSQERHQKILDYEDARYEIQRKIRRAELDFSDRWIPSAWKYANIALFITFLFIGCATNWRHLGFKLLSIVFPLVITTIITIAIIKAIVHFYRFCRLLIKRHTILRRLREDFGREIGTVIYNLVHAPDSPERDEAFNEIEACYGEVPEYAFKYHYSK